MSIVNPQTLRQLGCELWWPGEKVTANAPKTVTANGNATQILPFPGAGVAIFDGSGDYLSISNSSDFTSILSGNFTIETWVYCSDCSASRTIINLGCNSNANSICGIKLNIAGGYLRYGGSYDGSSWTFYSNTIAALSNNTWYHVALVRSSGIFYIYLNGILVFTNSSNTSTLYCGTIHLIGDINYSSHEYMIGYMSELRISNTARYATNFTPLRYQHTTDANTVLLLHFDRNDNTFVDSSIVPKTITAYGDAKHLTPFVGAGVGVFDGTGDTCAIANHTDLTLADECTIEFWVRPGVTTSQHIMGKLNVSSPYNGWYFGTSLFTYTNKLSFVTNANGTSLTTLSTLTAGTWYHVAIVRYTGVVTLYLDGVPQSTYTGVIEGYANPMYLGSFNNAASYFNGNLSEVRISSIARYNAPFAPPRHRLSPDHNTKLLIHFDSNGTTFTDVSPVPKTITRYGDAKCLMSPVGSGVAVFDGSGDYLQLQDSSDLNFRSSDFTWEAWFYSTSGNGVSRSIIATTNDAYNASGGQLRINATNLIQFTFINTSGTAYVVIGTTTIQLNTWYHVAGVRIGNILKLYVNGVQEGGDIACTGSQYVCTSWYKIGKMSNSSGGEFYFTGYISGIRLSNTARYSSTPITIQTTPFAEDDNTVLLLHFDGQTNVFKDASAKHKTITAYGDVKQLCSPVGSGVASFNSTTSDSISMVDVDDWTPGTNWTFECYVNFKSIISGAYADTIFSHAGGSYIYHHLAIGYDGAGNYFEWCFRSSATPTFSWRIGTYVSVNLHTWYHIACVKEGSNLTLYFNGIAVGTGTFSGSTPNLTSAFCIGNTVSNYTAVFKPFNGYIAEVQVLNIAKYSGSTITPPKVLFKPDVYTKLLLHMDGVGQSFADYSDTPVDNGFAILPAGCTITPSGTFATVKGKDGRTYLKFDGSTNYVNISDNNAWYLGSQDYTLIFWVNPSANTVYICGQASSDGNTISWYMSYWSDAKFHFRSWPSATELLSASTYSTGSWYHVAITRKGTLRSIYINGILSNTDTNSDTIPDLSYMFAIGAAGQYTGNRMNGIIKDLKLIKGSALTHEQINQIIDETFIY